MCPDEPIWPATGGGGGPAFPGQEVSGVDFSGSGAGGLGTFRILGTTNGGQPTSGTWNVGDAVIDRKYAVIWVCITAGTAGPVGTPGTSIWTGIGGYDKSARARGLLALSFDPDILVTQNTYGAGGYHLEKVQLWQGGTISQIITDITTAGAGLTNCFMGVYDAGGALLGLTADQSTNWQAVSASNPESDWQTLTVQAGVTLTRNAGEILFLALVIGGATTVPKFASPGVIGNAIMQNVGYKMGSGGTSTADDAWEVPNSITGGHTSLPAQLPAFTTAQWGLGSDRMFLAIR